MFDPKLDIRFGDALISGPEGQLELSGLLAELTVENANISIAANNITQR